MDRIFQAAERLAVCYGFPMIRTRSIAVLEGQGALHPQALLAEVVARLRGEGVRVVGVLAEDSDAEGACSAGWLRDIASGTRFSIQLDAAPAGTTCHMDASGIESACDLLLPQLASADLVLLSKFGKLEAMKQGLWRAFTAAEHAGMPLLTTVSSRHADAWKAWAPAAARVAPDLPAIEEWFRTLPA